MRTPKGEVHIQIMDPRDYIDVPPGHFIRIYAKRKGGRLYLASGPDRKHWEEIGPLTMPTLCHLFYDMGLVDVHEEEDGNPPVDMVRWMVERAQRRAGG